MPHPVRDAPFLAVMALACLAGAAGADPRLSETAAPVTVLGSDELMAGRSVGLDRLQRLLDFQELVFPGAPGTDARPGPAIRGLASVDWPVRPEGSNAVATLSVAAIDRIDVLAGGGIGYDLGLRFRHDGNGEDFSIAGGLFYEPRPDWRIVLGAPRPVTEILNGRPFGTAGAVLDLSRFGIYRSPIGTIMDQQAPFSVPGAAIWNFRPRATFAASWHHNLDWGEDYWSIGAEYFPRDRLRLSVGAEGGDGLDTLLRAGIGGISASGKFDYRFDAYHLTSDMGNGWGAYAEAGYRVVPRLRLGVAGSHEDNGGTLGSAAGIFAEYDVFGTGGSLPGAGAEASTREGMGLSLRLSAAQDDAGRSNFIIGASLAF
ncbi:MAG: hypothetical protein IT542_02280 [Rubellimicrobium sp.]|nr:hypothetical protein [Rubellimicrobium sp.]